MNDKLILALDTNSLKKAEDIIDEVKDQIKFYKIGSQLFTACGPAIIDMVRKKGGRIFLDLKFHDIPKTVCNSVSEALHHGIDMITVHTFGGNEMLAKTAETIRTAESKAGHKTLLVGVTLLTSLNNQFLEEIGIRLTVEEFVVKMATFGKKSGLDGVVASSNECGIIRAVCGKDFIIVTPGIRLKGNNMDDQKRIATPSSAIKNGSSYLVVGRPILDAKDKLSVIEKILKEMKNGL